MGNIPEKLKYRRKLAHPNAILQNPEVRGLLAEISKPLSYVEAVPKLSTTITYLRQVDDFGCLDVQNLLSFLRSHALKSKNGATIHWNWITELCKEGTIELCLDTWRVLFSKKLFQPNMESLAKSFRLILGILNDCTEHSTEAAERFCQLDGVQTILDSLKSIHLSPEILQRDEFNANRLYIAHTAFCILRNVLETCPLAKHIFRECDGVQICKQYLQCHVDILRCEAFMCLAFAVNEHENHVLLGAERPVNLIYIVKVMKDSLKDRDLIGHCPILPLLKALNRLAGNDVNKVHFGNLGLSEAYSKIIRQWAGMDEVLQALNGVWLLAFEERNRRRITRCKKLMESIIILTKAKNRKIAMAARGIVWTLDNRLEREAQRVRGFHQEVLYGANFSTESLGTHCELILAPANSLSEYVSSEDDILLSTTFSGNQPEGKGYVALIYEWKWKLQAERIQQGLREAGFDVRMEKSEFCNLDSTIERTEHASVILLCLSDGFRSSPACRSEADYIRLLHRDFVPLQLEPRYQADGWLGVLVGCKFVFDFSSDESISCNLPNLVAHLRDNLKIPFADHPADRLQIPMINDSSTAFDQTLTSFSMRKSKTMEPRRTVEHWTQDEVQQWLEKMGFRELSGTFDMFDGATLMALKRMSAAAPAVYYTSLKQEFRITDTLALLKFTNALELLI